MIDTLELIIQNGSSIFYPYYTDNGTIKHSSVDDSRYIEITNIALPTFKQNDTTLLLNIIGDVMLGNTQQAPILLNKIVFNLAAEANKLISICNGILTIEVCTEGQDRLLIYGGMLKSETINPVTTSYLEVKCSVHQIGTHTLEIIDNTGNIQFNTE